MEGMALLLIRQIPEKIIATHLDRPLNTHRLYNNHQSAYHICPPTETALLKDHQDITEALDNKCMATLVLCDLSAAFDVIDHRLLQLCPEYSLGLTGSALSWIQ